jgi:hypothetical protein
MKVVPGASRTDLATGRSLSSLDDVSPPRRSPIYCARDEPTHDQVLDDWSEMATEDGQADLVVRNAKVTTPQVDGDVAEVFAVRGGGR